MSESGNGFPRGRIGWIAGSIVLLGLGVLVGAILESIVLGLFIAAIVSLGWLIAYESWRGRTVGLDDAHDDGAQL